MSHYRVKLNVDTEEVLPARSSAVLKRAAVLALRGHDVLPGTEMSIVLADSRRVRQLNHQFREVNAPTDVLSFGMNETLPDGHDYLGDVVIGVQVARTQAHQTGHDLLAELSLLVIHGVLHLLGYDHATPEERAAMWTVQDDILAQLGLKAQPTED